MHVKPSGQSRLRSDWFTNVYQSTFSSKARGYAILFRKSVPFQLSGLNTDHSCRYQRVTGHINNIPITCPNIYGPNIDETDFF